MEQRRRRSTLFPGEVLVGGQYRIRVTDTELWECDGHGACYSLVVHLHQLRFWVPCPHTMPDADPRAYICTMQRLLSSSLERLGFPRDSVRALVRDLLHFVMDFAVSEHSCPSDGGARPIAVPRVYIASAEAEAPVWVKRATEESIEALEAVGGLEPGGRCAVCFEDLETDAAAAAAAAAVPVSRMPCAHVFHRDCIAGWLRNSHVCPLCRFQMPAVLVKKSSVS